MQDWTYEFLIKKLKAALAEVETKPDPRRAKPSPDGAHGQEASSAVARPDTLRPTKRTAKP